VIFFRSFDQIPDVSSKCFVVTIVIRGSVSCPFSVSLVAVYNSIFDILGKPWFMRRLNNFMMEGNAFIKKIDDVYVKMM